MDALRSGHAVVDDEGDAFLGGLRSGRAERFDHFADLQVGVFELVDEVGVGGEGAGPVVFLIPEIELDGLRLGGVVGSGGTLNGRGFLYLIVVGIALVVRGGKVRDGLGEAVVLGEGEGRRSRLRQVELLVLDIAVFHLALIEGEGEGRGRVREVGVFIVELLGDGHGAVLHLDIRNGMGFDRRICAVVGIDGDRTCVALVIAIGRSDLGDGIRRSIFLGMDRQGQSAVGVDGFILILMAVAVIKGERRAAERGGSVVLEFLQTDDADVGNGVDELSRRLPLGDDFDFDRGFDRSVRAHGGLQLIDIISAGREIANGDRAGRADIDGLHGFFAAVLHSFDLEGNAVLLGRGEDARVEGIILLLRGAELEIFLDDDGAAIGGDAVGVLRCGRSRLHFFPNGLIGDRGGVIDVFLIRLAMVEHEDVTRIHGLKGVGGETGRRATSRVGGFARESRLVDMVRGHSAARARRDLIVADDKLPTLGAFAFDGGQRIRERKGLQIERADAVIVGVGALEAIVARAADLDRPLDGDGASFLAIVRHVGRIFIHRPRGGGRVGDVAGGVAVLGRRHFISEVLDCAVCERHIRFDDGGEGAVIEAILRLTIVGHARGDLLGTARAAVRDVDGRTEFVCIFF